jgi:hypothetical protein
MYIVVSVKAVDRVVAVRVVKLCEGLILRGGARESAQFVEEGTNDGSEAPHFNGRRIHAKPRCQILFAVTIHSTLGVTDTGVQEISMCVLLSTQVKQVSCIRRLV